MHRDDQPSSPDSPTGPSGSSRRSSGAAHASEQGTASRSGSIRKPPELKIMDGSGSFNQSGRVSVDVGRRASTDHFGRASVEPGRASVEQQGLARADSTEPYQGQDVFAGFGWEEEPEDSHQNEEKKDESKKAIHTKKSSNKSPWLNAPIMQIKRRNPVPRPPFLVSEKRWSETIERVIKTRERKQGGHANAHTQVALFHTPTTPSCSQYQCAPKCATPTHRSPLTS